MSVFQRKYGVLTTGGTNIIIPIVKAGDTEFADSGDWTPGAGGVKVSKNGGASANIANLPTFLTGIGWVFILTAAELTCKTLSVMISDAEDIEDQFFIVETFGNASAMIPADISETVLKLRETLYPNAAIHIDIDSGAAGDTNYVNGTILNPSSSIADSLTMAVSLDLKTFVVHGKTGFTLPGGTWTAGYRFIFTNPNAEINLGSQTVDGMFITGAHVNGGEGSTTTGADYLSLKECILQSVILPRTRAQDCWFEHGVEVGESGVYEFSGFKDSRASASDAQLDFGDPDPGATTMIVSGYSGTITVKNMQAGDVLKLSGIGNVIFDSSNEGGDAIIGGAVDVEDNSDGTTVENITIAAAARYPNGFIFFDQAASNENTVLGVDGTPDNPVSTPAAAKTLADELGTKAIRVRNAFVASASMSEYTFVADDPHASFLVNGQAINWSSFTGFSVWKDLSKTAGQNWLYNCTISETSHIEGDCYDCFLGDNPNPTGTQTFYITSGMRLFNCKGHNPIFDFTGATEGRSDANNLTCKSLDIRNISDALYHVAFHLDGNPDVTIAATCDDGDLVLTGFINSLTDLKTGSMVVIDQTNLDVIKNKDANQNYEKAQHSLEAIGDGVGNIAVSGSAVNALADGNDITTGSEGATDYEDTQELDGNYNEITDDAGALDMYYEFLIGPTGIPVSATIIGFLTGVNDDLDIFAYDWVGAAWDQIGVINGKPLSENETIPVDLFPKHVGIGANAGKVRIRFYKASGLTSAQLNIDQIFTSFAIVNQSIGYDDGAIWVDTNASNTNTVPYFDGTADNPVSTWAAALTLNNDLNLNKFRIKNGSSITLTENSDHFVIEGNNYDIDLAGQSLNGAKIAGAWVTGNDDGSNVLPTIYNNCSMFNNTLGLHRLENCGLGGEINLAEAGTYDYVDCQSRVAGTATPILDFGAAVANVNLNMRDYSGGIEIKNMGQTGTDNMSLEGQGQLVINANSVGGTVAIRGNFGPITGAAAFLTAGGAIVDLGNITSLQGKTAGAATFDRATASLEGIRIRLIHSIKKNTAIPKLKFVMVDATSGNPQAGFTVTAARKLDADGSWTTMPGSGTIVDDDSGVYSIDIAQADTNGLTGAWRFTAPGAEVSIITLVTEEV